MDYNSRRAPLRRGRRVYLNASLSPETHKHLAKIGNGNRSAAIEILVAEHMERKRVAELELEPAT
jgi:hypothetical protein